MMRYLIATGWAFCLLLFATAPSWAQATATKAPPAKATAAKSAYTLKVTADRPDAIYKVGETATFTIALSKEGEAINAGEFKYRLTNDGYTPLGEGKLSASSAATMTVTGKLDKPGFLRISVEGLGADKLPVSASAAAGFDPTSIPPSMPVPNDFDAFWDEQRRTLATVALDPHLTPVASPLPKSDRPAVECFDVQIPTSDPAPVSGYFARPSGAKARSLPAVLTVHGAGVRSSSLPAAAGQADRGRLALDINAHGITNGKPETFYSELTSTTLRDYRAQGREDRQKCYFRGMYVRLMRALDFLCAQPEWDGKVLIVSGASQGGGQALAAAGLDSRVTAIYAGVPALCDHSGNVVNRIAGWPKIVPLVENMKPDDKVLQAARYIDGMNFATRIKADVIMSVGFIDGTCPPTSVYATFNNLPGKKQMVTGVLSGHEGPPDMDKDGGAFFAEHIARKRGE